MIEVGSVVKLRGQGVNMTVLNISATAARCVWYDSTNDLLEAILPLKALYEILRPPQ